ncbi:TPA: hypothetical protein ACOEA0_000654 [Stenotrophomonas maltophilia]
MNLSYVAVAVAALILGGCSEHGQLTSADVAQIKGDLSYLKSSQLRQDDFQSDLASRVKALESARANAPISAFFDPAGGPGYQYISTNVSPVVVSFLDVSPIGDGAKIRLRVGNLSTATYSGVRLDVTYNRRVPEHSTQLAAWNEGKREVSANDASDLAPGAWSIIEASLPGIKPDELGYIVVEAHLDNIRLRAPL